jgi:hypothetical protein
MILSPLMNHKDTETRRDSAGAKPKPFVPLCLRGEIYL